MLFSTLRLLLELKREDEWEPVRIFCEYKDAHCLLKHLPNLAATYKVDVTQMRIKNLLTHEAICEAKIAIDETEIKYRKRKKK